MSLIEIRSLIKDYPLGNTTVRALHGVDLTIAKGDMVCLMGPSGCGKSTLLNVIGGIDAATSGSVRIEGRELTGLADRELTSLRLHDMGFIFQSFNLIPVLSATENVEFPLLLQGGLSRGEVRKKAEKLLDDVGLSAYRHHRPAELSGGQRQRVAIARALVADPEIVLADEPTANLDSVTGAAILEIMKSMNEKKATTFLFSTHDPNVQPYARTVIRMKDGLLDGVSGAASVRGN